MSQSHLNYINGVPVKISEKYKPPVKIQLNQNIGQRLVNANNDINQIQLPNYEFSLEKNILAKLTEWQRVRQQQNCDRKERIRKRQQEHQRNIEEKQKQMLTAVSYPNADDLSSDDEHESSNDSTTTRKENEQTVSSIPSTPGHFSPPNHFDNILIPTVIPEQYTMNKRAPGVLTPRFNKINYSDFENDTSSPFDNVELKTINDLDILAQVLKVNTTISDGNKISIRNEPIQSKDGNQNQVHSTTNTHSAGNEQGYQNTYHVQQQTFSTQYPIIDNYYNQMQFINSGQTQTNEQAFNYAAHPYSNQQHNFPNKNLQHHQFMEYSKTNNAYFYHNGGNKDSPVNNYLYQNNSVNNRSDSNELHSKLAFQTQQAELSHIRSKSKSVPDIVQELNDELKNSQRKRTRNNSQSSISAANGTLNLNMSSHIVLFERLFKMCYFLISQMRIPTYHNLILIVAKRKT